MPRPFAVPVGDDGPRPETLFGHAAGDPVGVLGTGDATSPLLRLALVPFAMVGGLFLVTLGLAFAATVVGLPIGLALIGAGLRVFWL